MNANTAAVRILLVAQRDVIDAAEPGLKLAYRSLQNAIGYVMHGQITGERGIAHLRGEQE